MRQSTPENSAVTGRYSKWVGGVLLEDTSLDGLGFGRLGHQILSYDNEFTVKWRGGLGWKRRS